jgi:hypothetical protein
VILTEANGHAPALELHHLGPGLAWPQEQRPKRRASRPPGTWLLAAAAVLLLGLAAAQGWVSWRAQYTFIYAAKQDQASSTLEALGLDTGAVIFALLGLAHARMGRPARIERALNIACALGSMVMNLLGADLASPRSVAVYVLPALLYAAGSDRLIATAGHAAGVTETSLWHWAGTGLLYGLRALMAFPSTARGLRLRLLELTPLPGAQVTPEVMPASPVQVAPEPVPGHGSGRAQVTPRRKTQVRPERISDADLKAQIRAALKADPDITLKDLAAGLRRGRDKLRPLLDEVKKEANGNGWDTPADTRHD